MTLSNLITFLTGCLLGACPPATQGADTLTLTAAAPQGQEFVLQTLQPEAGPHKTLSGSYLSSQFAQRRQDWQRANDFLSDVVLHSPDNIDLSKRAMVLAAGSGDMERAIRLAGQIRGRESKSPLAQFFLAMGALKDKQYEKARALIETMPKGSMPDYIMPLVESWARAAVGVEDTQNLQSNSVYIYHAIMIADYLKQYGQVEVLLKQAEERSKDSDSALEQIAAVYAHIGKKAKATAMYEAILKRNPQNKDVSDRLAALRAGKDEEMFLKVAAPEEGVAQALSDMAQILMQEDSFDSARVFAQLALYLRPAQVDARFMLAGIAAQNEQYEEALAQYGVIKPDDPAHMEAQRRSAEILAKMGRTAEGIALLEELARTKGDVQSLLTMGDIYRESKDYAAALRYYNKAAEQFKGKIPENYWNIYYVRGIAYDLMGNWPAAESDFKAALEMQPDHPYVLNYLGYAWAERGINLSQSLELLKRAVTLKPDDGSITDSLGWSYFKMGRFEDSLPYLERAVELLPYDPVINDHLGDAYWKLGRKMEARFQWQRSLNFTQDQTLSATLQEKLSQGLAQGADESALKNTVREARSNEASETGRGEEKGL